MSQQQLLLSYGATAEPYWLARITDATSNVSFSATSLLSTNTQSVYATVSVTNSAPYQYVGGIKITGVNTGSPTFGWARRLANTTWGNVTKMNGVQCNPNGNSSTDWITFSAQLVSGSQMESRCLNLQSDGSTTNNFTLFTKIYGSGTRVGDGMAYTPAVYTSNNSFGYKSQYASSVNGKIEQQTLMVQRFDSTTGASTGTTPVATRSTSTSAMMYMGLIPSQNWSYLFAKVEDAESNFFGILKFRTLDNLADTLLMYDTAYGYGHSCAPVNDGNVYVTLAGSYPAGNTFTVLKLTSTFTKTWAQTFSYGTSANTVSPYPFYSESEGALYIIVNWSTTANSTTGTDLLKINTSTGALTWGRRFTDSTGNVCTFSAESSCVNSTCIFLGGWYGTGLTAMRGLLIKYPTDGSKTGTYGNTVIASITPTGATNSTYTVATTANTFLSSGSLNSATTGSGAVINNHTLSIAVTTL